MDDLSLYIHIPFCRRRCGYCDFNTFAGMTLSIPDYVEVLCQEIQSVLSRRPEQVQAHTIYFGGGTPSLITVEQYSQIFTTIRQGIPVTGDAEISLEANPGTVSKDYLEGLYQAGFNRISFGMQSSNPFELKVLDREHVYADVVNAVKWSKQVGFKHINLDLIFGIPGQTVESWMRTIELAMMFDIDHFSIYSLIVEEGTPLKKWIDKGLVVDPDDDTAAEMYESTMDFLAGQGFTQYEISNWSKDERSRCKHNLQYWRFLPYLGFGAGAHGFWHDMRTENRGLIPDYINQIRNGIERPFPHGAAALQETRLSDWARLEENLMVSLRLTEEGISHKQFKQRYGVEIEELFQKQVEKLKALGLIEIFQNGERIRLTRKGCFFGNRVFSEFVENDPPRGYEYLDSQYT